MYFHDPIFVKWKPTIIFWLFALANLLPNCLQQNPNATYDGKMQDKGHIPVNRNGNIMWALSLPARCSQSLHRFFYSDDIRNKFYGITTSLLLFSIFQAFYLSRFLEGETEK